MQIICVYNQSFKEAAGEGGGNRHIYPECSDMICLAFKFKDFPISFYVQSSSP